MYKVSNETNYHVWLNFCSAFVSTHQKTDCYNGSVIADHRNEQVMITLKYVINVNHIKGHIKLSLAGIWSTNSACPLVYATIKNVLTCHFQILFKSLKEHHLKKQLY